MNDRAPDIDVRSSLRLSAILSRLCDPASMECAPAATPVETADMPPVPASGRRARRAERRTRRRMASHVTLGDMLDRASHAGFGFMLGLLALISIPFFGLSTPFGLAIAFGAAQMAIGLSKPWLPNWIRRRRLSVATLELLSRRVARWTAGIERLIRPRFTTLLRGPFWSLCGLAIMIQGLALALPLPVPGSNWIFIVPIIVYAIGLLEDDGLLILLCHAVTAVQIVLGIWAWERVWAALLHALHWLHP